MSKLEIDLKENSRCYMCLNKASFIIFSNNNYLLFENVKIRSYCDECIKLIRMSERKKLFDKFLKLTGVLK